MKNGTLLLPLLLFTYGNAQQLNDISCKKAPSTHETEEVSQCLPNISHKENGAEGQDSAKKAQAAIKLNEDEKKKGEEENKKEKSPHTFATSICLVSDYRIRGISQTMRRPAIQGGFYYTNTNGLYLGTWASNVDGTTHFYNNTSLEWDFFGGYQGKFSVPDFSYALVLLYYYYPGGQANNSHHTKFNTVECYAEITYKTLTIKYSQSLTNYFGTDSNYTPFNWSTNLPDAPNGSSRGSHYIEANFTHDLVEKVHFGKFEAGKLHLLLHLGHQKVRHYSNYDYSDWKITLTQQFEWFDLFITYVGTDAKHAYYDVPDNAFSAKKRNVGGQAIVFGALRFL